MGHLCVKVAESGQNDRNVHIAASTPGQTPISVIGPVLSLLDAFLTHFWKVLVKRPYGDKGPVKDPLRKVSRNASSRPSEKGRKHR